MDSLSLAFSPEFPASIPTDPAILESTPALQPPPGVSVDFDRPNPRRITAVTVTSIFIFSALLFVSIRVYVKVRIVRRASWDDLTCALGLITTLLVWVLFLMALSQGVGQHQWNIRLSSLTSNEYLKMTYVRQWSFFTSLICIKVSFFILYWTIFRPFRWLRYGVMAGGVIVPVVYLAFLLANMIDGTPRSGETWFNSVVRCKICFNIMVPVTAWGVVSDTYILILPIFGIMRLQLSLKEKVGVLMLFMTGLGACICSSLSLYYLVQITDDNTYAAMPFVMLSTVEPCVGICITCVPSISKLLRHLFPPGNKLGSTLEIRCKGLLKSLTMSRSRTNPTRGSHHSKANENGDPYRNVLESNLRVKPHDDCELALHPGQAVTTSVMS